MGTVKAEAAAGWGGFYATGAAVTGAPLAPPEPLPREPWEFAVRCCVTLDERAGETGKGERRPFPDWPYLRELLETIDRERFLRVDKSGQVLVSWGVLCFVLHHVLTTRGSRWAYYCMTQMRAEGHLQSRLLRLYQSIPATFAKPHAEIIGGQFRVFHDGPHKLPSSWVIPMAAEQGAHADAAEKMRSETWTAALLDESAFYPNLEELHASLLPRAGRLVHVSTPNGGNFFARLGFGVIGKPSSRLVEFDELPEVESRGKGVWLWRRNGFAHLRVHYRAHPDRDPETPTGAAWVSDGRSRTTPSLWEREQEISYKVAAGQPVYQCDPVPGPDGKLTGGLIVKPQTYTPGLYLWRGWDFGYRHPAVTFAQVKPLYDANGRHLRDRLHVLYELTQVDSSTDQLAETVNSATHDRFVPEPTVNDACDFYGGNQRTSRNPKTDVEILADHGIHAACSPAQKKMGVELIRKLLRQGDLEVDPACTYLVTALRSGYVLNDQGEIPSEAEEQSMHPHVDHADSLRYLVMQSYMFASPARPAHRPKRLDGGARQPAAGVMERHPGIATAGLRPAADREPTATDRYPDVQRTNRSFRPRRLK